MSTSWKTGITQRVGDSTLKKFLKESHEHHIAITEKVNAIMAKFVSDQNLASSFALQRINVEQLRPRKSKDGTPVTDYQVDGYLIYDGKSVVRFNVKAHYMDQLGIWLQTLLWLKLKGSECADHIYPLRNRHSSGNWGVGSWDEEQDEITFQRRNESIDFDEAVVAA